MHNLIESLLKENKSLSKAEKKKITEAPDMYGLPTDDEIKRQRSWYESDPYRKQIFQIADDFKKEFGIKAKTKYASYGFTREGDKEFRTYQVNLETGRDALRPLFIDGKAWMGLKPEYQGRFVTNSKGRKANWELEDGESQIEINPDYVIIQLRAVLDRDEAERQRNQDADDYDLAFRESVKKKVNESVASDIYKEIKDKYPDVKIKIFSKDGRAVLRFTNYPGEGATGFGNDPRTEKRDNWKSFLQYVSKKHGGDPELDGIYPDEMNIWDLKEESVKKLKESKKNGSYYANKYLSRRDWYNIESDWEYKMNTGALSKLGWDDSLGKYVSPRSEVIKAYEQDFPRDQQVQNWADAIADQINDNRDYNYPFGYNKEEVDPDLDIGAAVYDYIRNIFIRDYVATRSSVKKSKEESLKESVADPREYDLEDLGMTSEEADRARQEADDELTRLMDRMGVDANDAANHSRWSRVVDDIAYLVASCRRYDIEPYKYNER